MPAPVTESPSAVLTDAERATHEIVCENLSAAIVELVGDYGLDAGPVHVLPEPSCIEGHQVAGIIGFAGPHLGGTLAIRAASETVRRCLPVRSVAALDTQAVGDWIAELANQLIGRTKNKLLRYDVTFQLTPPTFAAANELLVLGCDGARTSWLSVTTSAGPWLAMLELRSDPHLTLALVSDGSVAYAEGEMLLF